MYWYGEKLNNSILRNLDIVLINPSCEMSSNVRYSALNLVCYGVGGTKACFINFSIYDIFDLADMPHTRF